MLHKRLIFKSQVFVAHSFWVICRNVSRTFVELCMETPCWCTVLVHQYVRRKTTKNIWSSLFLWKLFLFTREPAYVRINISSDTWSGYTAENQEERLFCNETAFLFWCHALWKFGSSNCCIFETKMLRKCKLGQRFTFLFIFNLV